MHHQLANQELARIRYAEAIRNSTRELAVAHRTFAPASPVRGARGRLRIAVGNLFAHVPASRSSLGYS